MGRIGLFGGTFNPPHKGHIALAKRVLSEFSLDRLIFIPAGNPPHKTDKCITDKAHRFSMIKIAVQNLHDFPVSDFEINNEKPSYSYIAIEHFKKVYPDDEIFFIIGADSYRDFPKWKNYPDILSLCTFVVMNRNNDDLNRYYLKYRELCPGHKALFSEDFSYDLSSTELRDKLSAGEDCTELLPDGVYEYIVKNNLYRKESL